jgi:hypothetical protein
VLYSSNGVGYVEIASGVKAGPLAWQIHQPESLTLWLRVQALDQSGSIVAEENECLAVVPADCFIVSKNDQKVWWFAGGKLKDVLVCSTAGPEYHLHDGWFRIYLKELKHWSREWEVWMPHTMFFFEGHAFHATTVIRRLGTAASHGCVRLHPRDATRIYEATRVGTAVAVMPEGFDCTFLGKPAAPPARPKRAPKGN